MGCQSGQHVLRQGKRTSTVLLVLLVLPVLVLSTASMPDDDPPQPANDTVMLSEARTLVMTGPELPGIFSTEKPGPYNILYEELIARSPFSVKFLHLPLRRAIRALKEGRADCFYLGSNDAVVSARYGFDMQDYIYAGPITDYRVLAFARAEDAPGITGAADFEGRNVAADMAVAASFPELVLHDTLSLSTNAVKVKALARGDIDILLGFDNSMPAMIAELGLDNVILPSPYTVIDTSVGISCRKDAGVNAQLEYLGNLIGDMRANGDLKRILAE